MTELVARAREGDRDAFAELYRRHVDRVYAVCLRIVADRSRAEDLTQEAFIRCWEKLDGFRGESRFGTWLHRLATNLALDATRGDRRETDRRGALERERAADGSGGDSGPGPAERLDLERAVAGLPAGARRAVVLHDIHGYRYEEIAEMMGVALGTVKSQIHRGRRLLRERLEA